MLSLSKHEIDLGNSLNRPDPTIGIKIDMEKQKTTQSATGVMDGIEYNEYPSPERLIKTKGSKWAIELMKRGLLRLGKLEYYQNWENHLHKLGGSF